MKLRLFAHSWLSDWNHGNAHFLRGWATALAHRGHQVRVYEELASPTGGWSLSHLLAGHPEAAPAWLAHTRAAFPTLDIRFFRLPNGKVSPPEPAPPLADVGVELVASLDAELRDATHVLVHEWNPPQLFEYLRALRHKFGFRLLLLDTHHRLLSQPQAMARLHPHRMDAVLAFGESLRREYETHWRVARAYTLHEAADVEHFRPAPEAPATPRLVFIGNWGDDERSAELEEFLLAPAADLARSDGLELSVHGVRYPDSARRRLQELGIAYAGYLPNLHAPALYAQAGLTVHIPRRPYANGDTAPTLPGIPTIRVFEALACGAALVCSPWRDNENLFRSGTDFWIGRDGAEMRDLLMQLLRNPKQRKQLAQNGWETIQARHTCSHRAAELEEICHDLG